MTFIDRFLYHVLPKHFHRIRYYGFLANGKAKANIETIKADLPGTANPEQAQENGMCCTNCEKGTMMTLLVIDGYGNIIADNSSKKTQPAPALANST